MSRTKGQWRRARELLASTQLRLLSSAVLAGIISTVRGGELLVFVALIPLIAYVFASNKYPKKVIVRDLYLYSWIICAFANLFLFQLAPENWNIPISPAMSIFARFISWFVMCSLISASFALLGWILASIRNKNQRVAALIILFPVAELLRSYLYAIVSYGPGASLSPNYNWGTLAVSVAATPLVYISRYVGFFGLSFAALLIAALVYYAWNSRRLIYVCGLLVIFALTISSYVIGNSTSGEVLSVSALHLGEKDDAKRLNPDVWPPEGTDLFVLPEYSDFAKSPQANEVAQRLSTHGLGVTTVVNGPSPSGTNRMQIFDRNNAVVDTQDKTFLIPNGEFLPYLLQAVLAGIGKQNISFNFKYTQQINPGEYPEHVYKGKSFTVGALACSGVSALNEYNRLSRDGADILVNSASLAFFTNKSFYHTYAFNMARYHAVANRKPLVQASRSGESYIIDKQGRVVGRWAQNSTATLNARVQL